MKKWVRYLAVGVMAAAAAGSGIYIYCVQKGVGIFKRPEQICETYLRALQEEDYKAMYEVLSENGKEKQSQEEFAQRYENILEGIQAHELVWEITEAHELSGGNQEVQYQLTMQTLAGEIQGNYRAVFEKEKGKGYRLQWQDSLIFPSMEAGDKVRVETTEAKRGSIFDRNGVCLAGPGTVSNVGLVPGKMSEDPGADLEKLASLLDTSVESIQKKLDASWVKEDSFVPIRMIEKVTNLELSVQEEETASETALLQDELLGIPGVMISDEESRVYSQKEAAAHLVGYVQNITAEELKEHEGEGYTANSVIGKSGLEALYEKELKGQDGCRIVITDAQGEEKETLAVQPTKDGKNVNLTIDMELQKELYRNFSEDKGASVAMDPFTGEVLALVSTPGFDNNLFVLGMSQSTWDGLNQDENNPLLNRFRNTWCPGSSLKPVVGAIGVSSGKLDPEKDFGNEGETWQKDESWGAYTVTTLHSLEPVNLENSLICSDNIYFAKAALEIGEDELTQGFKQVGFGEEIPFPIKMTKSQYSNEEDIASEVQLADSGYGQGQILVNPLHLASIYSAFVNEGSMIAPRLLQDDSQPEYWKEGVFTKEAVQRVNKALLQVITHPEGTGRGCEMEGIALAGKTGTAEIKAAKEDETGTELGWFAVYTPEPINGQGLLLVSMAEDVKDRGGSSYVVDKDRVVLESWLAGSGNS